MTTAFVLSGGASLGAVQVGMLQALADAGIEPDLLIGTSVGALNAAWVAGDPTPGGIERLAAVWTGIRRRDVFPTRPVYGLLGFLGRRPSLVPAHGLRSLLRQHLPFRRLEDAPVPVHVVATEVRSGREVLLSRGDALDAVYASAAIPGVLPPVRVGGIELMDGGVANNTPISHAIALGADRVWVLSTGYACDLEEMPRGALAMALQAVTLLVQRRLLRDIADTRDRVDLRVLPPLCPLDVSPIDFSRTRELIERAATTTGAWLAAPTVAPVDVRALTPHSHDGDR